MSYEVTDQNGEKNTLTIEQRDVVYQGDADLYKCEIGFEPRYANTWIPLNFFTNINDINSIRYQLGKSSEDKARQFAHFIDQFVIFTTEERRTYQKYKREKSRW